jgi:hypothetical protein
VKAATLVGETTAGAANLTNSVPLVRGFQISVPYARGSETTWEGIGVAPDIAARAPEALGVAVRRLGLKTSSGEIDALSQVRLFTPRSTAAPGGEAAVRHLIQDLQRADPHYERLNEPMAQALRERATALHDLLVPLGDVEAVRLVEINWLYGDIYEVKFANGVVYWAIALDPRGRIVMWEARLASRS